MSSSTRCGRAASSLVQQPATDRDDMGPDDALAAKATKLHALGRLRGELFLSTVMMDSAMDLMLSLLVGELQAKPVHDTTLAVANMLGRVETNLMIDKLVDAGLVRVASQNGDRRTVALTPLGSARMRSFVNDYPAV